MISLALNLDSRVKVALLIGSFVLEGAFGILIFLAHRKINALITKLEQA